MRLDKEAKDAAAKAKKKKKKKQELEEEEADRAQLWQALSSTDALTRDKLEHLYWDEVSPPHPPSVSNHFISPQVADTKEINSYSEDVLRTHAPAWSESRDIKVSIQAY